MEPFLGQVEIFSFNYAPKGWAFCQGQLLSIQQNTALFSLFGTYYGGNGTTNFGLPDLRARAAIGMGNGAGLPPYTIGQVGGEENHLLSAAENASHNHTIRVNSTTAASNNSDTPSTTVVLGQTTGKDATQPNYFPVYLYTSGSASNSLSPSTIGMTGGQPHPNMMPYLTVSFCVALVGIYPTRN
jgi:microcystin-dependent protein